MALVSQANYSRIYFLLLAAIAFTLPFPMAVANALIGLLLLAWLLSGHLGQKLKVVGEKRLALLFIGLFVIQVAGLLYTSNMKEGWFQIEKSLSLLLFPLIIFSSPNLTPKQYRRVLFFFVLGCLIAMTSSLVWALYRRFVLQSLTQVEINNFFIDLPRFHGLTHVYFGLYLALAFFITAYLYWEQPNRGKWHFPIVTGVMIYLFAFMLFSTGTMAFIAFLFVSVVVGVWKIESKRLLLKNFLIVIPLIFLGVFLLYKNTALGDRLHQRFSYSFDTIENNPYNYSATRMGPLKSSLSLLREEWLLGFGTGDVNDEMTGWYKENNLHLLSGFNSHNQYLGILLLVGIPGLFLYLLSLFYPLFLSFRFGLYLYASFLFLIISCSFSENLLESNKGIVFYAFFNSFFASQWINSNKILFLRPSI